MKKLNKYALLAAAMLSLLLVNAQAETQTFNLASQWNLIGFQIEPKPSDPDSVFGQLSNLGAVWTYDAEQKQWKRYSKSTGTGTQAEDTKEVNKLLSIGNIEPGKAYWVYMGHAETLTVSGTLPEKLEVNFTNGWNMFSIPVGATEIQEKGRVSLLSVLAGAGLNYDALLTWENSKYKKMFNLDDTEQSNPLSGITPDSPLPYFDYTTDLGRGYFIHIKDIDPAALRPKLLSTIRPDVDEEPKGNFPDKEDLKVSLASKQAFDDKIKIDPKDVNSQDTIRFFADEDVQQISISNTGGGIMLWEAKWEPKTDLDAGDWIHLSDIPLTRWDTSNACDTVSGVTTLENDIIYLNLDRKNLGRGIHKGRVILTTSVGEKTYDVVAEVSGLQGDFNGFAEITSVNGKQNKVPDIDLNISFYEDSKVNGFLRGYIDSSRSLLWPVDVPLVGYRVADEGNQFMLSGSFVLPPGDQNGEPFDKFMIDPDPDSLNPNVGKDVDWNKNGEIDAKNPFPFPIQRLVTLEGTLNTANPAEGYVVEGCYTEIVYGMTSEPIELMGTFTLNRRNARPFTFRKGLGSDTGVEPVVLKKSTLPLTISSGGQRSSVVDSVKTEMELQGLQVSLDFSQLNHSNIRIELQSPQGTILTLFDGYDQSDSVNPNTLKSITFPIGRPTASDMDAFINGITQTHTDPEKEKCWVLTIYNRGNEAIKLLRWSLQLEGQPVSDVSGIVRNEKGNPVAGATVALNGVAFSQYSNTTDANGRFTMERVPLLPLDFTVQLPGYVSADPDFAGLSTSFRTPYSKIDNTTSELEKELIEHFNPLAGATVAIANVDGFEDGTVESPFELGIKPENPNEEITFIVGPAKANVKSLLDCIAVGSIGNWNFGDGKTEQNKTVVTHVYEKPGVYTVQFVSGGKTYETQVVALASPGNVPAKPADLGGVPTGLAAATQNANYRAYVFYSSLTCAGTYVESAIKPQEYAPTAAAVTMSYMPVQYACAASMDIDLAPKVAAGKSKPYDSDGFVPLDGNPNNDSNVNDYGFRNEDFDYALPPGYWKDTKDINGLIEYNQEKAGLMIWGHTFSDESKKNYYSNYLSPSTSYSALDGVSYDVYSVDDVYHPHRGTTVHDKDDVWEQTVTHYRVTCSIGSSAGVLVEVIPLVSVKEAKLSRMDVDNPSDADLIAAPVSRCRNLKYQLSTGILALDQ